MVLPTRVSYHVRTCQKILSCAEIWEWSWNLKFHIKFKDANKIMWTGSCLTFLVYSFDDSHLSSWICFLLITFLKMSKLSCKSSFIVNLLLSKWWQVFIDSFRCWMTCSNFSKLCKLWKYFGAGVTLMNCWTFGCGRLKWSWLERAEQSSVCRAAAASGAQHPTATNTLFCPQLRQQIFSFTSCLYSVDCSCVTFRVFTK